MKRIVDNFAPAAGGIKTKPIAEHGDDIEVILGGEWDDMNIVEAVEMWKFIQNGFPKPVPAEPT